MRFQLVPCILLGLILLSSPGIAPAQYQTNVHHGLALESEIHDVTGDQKALDAIIRAANTRIHKKKDLTRQEAVKVLKTIHQILQDQKPRFTSHVLRENDCKSSILYVAVGEALRLPIQGVVVPNHIFVRYEFAPGKSINWETLYAKSVPDKQYIEKHHIAEVSILNGAYMRSLNPGEITALHYVIVGKAWARRHKLDKAMRHYNEAVRRYPSSPGCYNQRGIGWLQKRSPQNALKDLNQALALDPHYAQAFYNRGLAFIRLNRLESALQDFNRTLDLAPQHARSFYWRGYVKMRQGDVKGAVQDHQQAVQLDKNLLYERDYTQ